MPGSAHMAAPGAALAIILAFGPGPIAAQDITDEGMARAVARMLTVERECPGVIAMNLELVRNAGRAFQDVLTQRLGAARAQQSIAEERAAMRSDLDRAGRYAWCTGVARSYQRQGLGQLFEAPR